MLHSACLIQLFLCFFFSVSHQRSKSTQERLALIPAVSQSSCGWPGRASLPLCLPSGSLGKWEERSWWVESPAAWPSTAAVLICSALFAAFCGSGCITDSYLKDVEVVVMRYYFGFSISLVVVNSFVDSQWKYQRYTPSRQQILFDGNVVRERLCDRPSFIGLDQGWMSVLDTWWWRCIATIS